MSRRALVWFGTAALIVAALAAGCQRAPAPTQGPAPPLPSQPAPEPEKPLEDLMEQNEHSFKAMMSAVEAGNLEEAAEHADALRAQFEEVKAYEEAEDFQQFASDVQAQLETAQAADAETAAAEYKAVGAGCKACHDVYRKGHEQHGHEAEAEEGAHEEEAEGAAHEEHAEEPEGPAHEEGEGAHEGHEH
ncbi:MAG: hypothetical protein ACE5R4_16330 [Armatimonadota bacterium]